MPSHQARDWHEYLIINCVSPKVNSGISIPSLFCLNYFVILNKGTLWIFYHKQTRSLGSFLNFLWEWQQFSTNMRFRLWCAWECTYLIGQVPLLGILTWWLILCDQSLLDLCISDCSDLLFERIKNGIFRGQARWDYSTSMLKGWLEFCYFNFNFLRGYPPLTMIVLMVSLHSLIVHGYP